MTLKNILWFPKKEKDCRDEEAGQDRPKRRIVVNKEPEEEPNNPVRMSEGDGIG